MLLSERERLIKNYLVRRYPESPILDLDDFNPTGNQYHFEMVFLDGKIRDFMTRKLDKQRSTYGNTKSKSFRTVFIAELCDAILKEFFGELDLVDSLGFEVREIKEGTDLLRMKVDRIPKDKTSIIMLGSKDGVIDIQSFVNDDGVIVIRKHGERFKLTRKTHKVIFI